MSDLAQVDAHEIDPREYDEAPDLTDMKFSDAVLEVAGKPVRGRPSLGEKAKRPLSLRLDPAVINHFKAMGPGWQVQINAFLRSNETVVRMIDENEDLIKDMEQLLAHFRSGELRMVTEPADRTVARLERNIRNVKETVRSLRGQLGDQVKNAGASVA
jgi:uncharacterized protein (DUF4415 family)